MSVLNKVKGKLKSSREGMKKLSEARVFNYYINAKQTLGLLFLSFAFTIFALVANRGGDISRMVVVGYGLIVSIMALHSIYTYIKKTVALQNDRTVSRYVSINSINTFIGFIAPVFILNEIVRSLVILAAQITNYDSLFCQIRCSAVHYYWRSGIYSNINTLLFWALVILFAYWLIGGFVERISHQKSA